MAGTCEIAGGKRAAKGKLSVLAGNRARKTTQGALRAVERRQFRDPHVSTKAMSGVCSGSIGNLGLPRTGDANAATPRQGDRMPHLP
jgi:hypothetical protein